MITAPLHFPSEAEVPETKEHLELRTALYLILQFAFADRAWIGCDQFVYWNPREPRRCLAPDAFLKHGGPDDRFPVWKTWERGVPDLAVEIVSATDERRWEDKLRDYSELGIRELVRFHPAAPAGTRIELWERADDGLVVRTVLNDRAESRVLPGHCWVVGACGVSPAALRLVGPDGMLLPTEAEHAKQRIVELEAELARRK